MFEAVIFDWDGTLADTRQVIVASFQRALSDVGCDVGGEFIERRIGIGAAETFREILRASNMSFNKALVASLVEKKVQTEIEMSNQVKLFEGATALLKSLRPKVKLALASMSNRDFVDHMLKAMNIQRFFDVVLTADEVNKSKPDPEIFLKSAGNWEPALQSAWLRKIPFSALKPLRQQNGLHCSSFRRVLQGRAEKGKSRLDHQLVKGKRQNPQFYSPISWLVFPSCFFWAKRKLQLTIRSSLLNMEDSFIRVF